MAQQGGENDSGFAYFVGRECESNFFFFFVDISGSDFMEIGML